MFLFSFYLPFDLLDVTGGHASGQPNDSVMLVGAFPKSPLTWPSSSFVQTLLADSRYDGWPAPSAN